MLLLLLVSAILLSVVLIYDIRSFQQLRRLKRQAQKPTPLPKPSASLTCKVDVVIPIYNMGNTIVKTLRSLEASQYPHKRLIVVDDGSDDVNTAQTLAELAAKIDILQRIPHQGKAAAANHGASLGNGEVIIFLDADSVVTPGFIETALSELDRQTDAVDFVPQVANPNESIWTQIAAFEREMLALQPDNFGALFVIKRTIFEKLLFRPGSAPQFELNQRLLQQGRLKTAPQKIVYSDEPTTFRAVYRRKRRWLYGMLETLRLHRQSPGWQIYLPLVDLLLLSTGLLAFIEPAFLLIPLVLLFAWWLKAYLLSRMFHVKSRLSLYYVIYMLALMVAVIEAMLRFRLGKRVPWT